MVGELGRVTSITQNARAFVSKVVRMYPLPQRNFRRLIISHGEVRGSHVLDILIFVGNKIFDTNIAVFVHLDVLSG